MTAQDELIDLAAAASSTLVRQAEGLEPLLGEEKQRERLSTLMRESGFDEAGPFRYAPREAVEQAWSGFKGEDEARLGRQLADVQDGVAQLEKLMPLAEAIYMQPPSVETVVRQRLGNIEQSPSTYISTQLLDATLESVLTPAVARMGLIEAAKAYRDAAADPLLPRHAAMMALIEGKVTAGGFPPSEDPEVLEASRDLVARVQTTRQARIPEQLKVWRAAVARGRRTLILARAANLKAAASIEQQHLVTLMKSLG
jgi:hypothetical protein